MAIDKIRPQLKFGTSLCSAGASGTNREQWDLFSVPNFSGGQGRGIARLILIFTTGRDFGGWSVETDCPVQHATSLPPWPSAGASGASSCKRVRPGEGHHSAFAN